MYRRPLLVIGPRFHRFPSNKKGWDFWISPTKLSASLRPRWLSQAPFASFPMIRISGHGGRETRGTKLPEKVGRGGTCPGTKRWFCCGKNYTSIDQQRKGIHSLVGWLVEKFHFKIRMPIVDVFFVTGSWRGTFTPSVPSQCWRYNLSLFCFFLQWLQNMVPKNLEGFPESFRSNYIVKLYGLKRGFSVELHKFRGIISQKLQHILKMNLGIKHIGYAIPQVSGRRGTVLDLPVNPMPFGRFSCRYFPIPRRVS